VQTKQARYKVQARYTFLTYALGNALSCPHELGSECWVGTFSRTHAHCETLECFTSPLLLNPVKFSALSKRPTWRGAYLP